MSVHREASFGALRDAALKLGFPELAEAIKTEMDKADVAREQKRFETAGSRDFSFLAPPLSYKRLMDVLVKRLSQTPDSTQG